MDAIRSMLEQRYKGQVQVSVYPTRQEMLNAWQQKDQRADLCVVDVHMKGGEQVCLVGKPVRRERLSDVADSVFALLDEKMEEMVTLTSKSLIIRLRAADISYVESERRVLTIHTADEDVRVNMKLSDLEGRLPDYFVRIHQSYLVNMERIHNFSVNGVLLENGEVIPISRPRYAKAKECFLHFLGEPAETKEEGLPG